MNTDVDCIVIGAGVVGLAVARAIAQTGLEVLVAEQGEDIGVGTSSRNSEVIHAGLYYPTNSLKSRLCVQGKELLYEYCQTRGIPHQRLGKLLVATDQEELALLEGIQAQAARNGVHDLQRLSQSETNALEPALHCTGALLSPSTGIVDSHALMLAYQGDAEQSGAQFVFHCPYEQAKVMTTDQGETFFEMSFGGEEPITLTSRWLINAAGLSAVAVANAIEGLNQVHVPKAYLCKGNYYTLTGRAPFKHLIYPIPRQNAGLGVHLTLDLGGQAKFGPDTEWITEENYDVDFDRCQSFYAAVRRYWPGLQDNTLQPGYAGIRPKISGPDEPAADFVISTPKDHATPGLINLFGIESPGLTASLAIAREVDQVVRAHL